jgi:hypothetical protein
VFETVQTLSASTAQMFPAKSPLAFASTRKRLDRKRLPLNAFPTLRHLYECRYIVDSKEQCFVRRYSEIAAFR